MSATSLLAGRYRLTAELGRGGMGVVWQAHDDLLHRDVAVKEVSFPPDLSREERERLAGRTLREARAVAAVETPAAVRVFDVVEQDGRPWIVMELVRGQTLTAWLRERGNLPPREVARIGLALLEALDVAHTAGVLHRDVKPSNVLIGDDGRVALTDFGIATVDGDGSDTTTTGVIVGSPAYVAPERLHGEHSSSASDLWSLGATLWTAAEGRAPYTGETAMAVMSSVAMTDPPGCSVCGGALADVLRQMMDRDPARRPDAATVRAVLTQVLAEPDTEPATEPSPTEQLPVAFDRTTVLDAGTAAEPKVVAEPTPAAPPTPARGSRRALGIGVAVLTLAVLGAALAIAIGHHSTRSQTGSHARATHSPSHQPAAASVPAGWSRYRDASLGWSIAVPPGWQRSTDSGGTRFTDPAGGRYILVATRYPAGSSAVAAWQSSEREFESSHQSYRRLRLETIRATGTRDAADWEFTYVDGGAALHALDRALVFGNRGYAIFVQSHTDQWASSQPLFDRVIASFGPGSG